MVVSALRRRVPNLGDKLQRLVQLAPQDVRAIEAIVDYRIEEHQRKHVVDLRMHSIVPWPNKNRSRT